MSMYNLVNDGFHDWQKSGYKQWPNPFRGSVKQIKVLACQDTWQAKIEMWGLAAGAWWWSAFVPQPSEVIRKSATGRYKCGFFLLPELPSPVEIVFDDIIFPNKGPKELPIYEVFAEMVRPAVTGLFYLWATETFFSALDQFQSVIYAQEMCDLDHGETLLAEGSGEMFFGSGVGSPGFYDELHDPENHYTFPGGDVELHYPASVSLDAVGHILAGGGHVNNIRVFFARGSTEPIPGSQVWESGPMDPGAVAAWSLSWGGIEAPGTFQIVVEYDQTHTGLQRSHILVTRWTSTFRHTPYEPCKKWKPSRLPVIG